MLRLTGMISWYKMGNRNTNICGVRLIKTCNIFKQRSKLENVFNNTHYAPDMHQKKCSRVRVPVCSRQTRPIIQCPTEGKTWNGNTSLIRAGIFRWRNTMLLFQVFWWSAWSQGSYVALSIKSAFLNPAQSWNNKLLPALPCGVGVPLNKCLLSAEPLWAPNNFPWYGGNIYHPGTICRHIIKAWCGELCHKLLAASRRVHDTNRSIHKETSKTQSRQSKTLPTLFFPDPSFHLSYIVTNTVFRFSVSDLFSFLFNHQLLTTKKKKNNTTSKLYRVQSP